MKILTPNDVLNSVSKIEYQKIGEKTKVCCLTLSNGLEVIGHAYCQRTIGEDVEYGNQVAFNTAVQNAFQIVKAMQIAESR